MKTAKLLNARYLILITLGSANLFLFQNCSNYTGQVSLSNPKSMRANKDLSVIAENSPALIEIGTEIASQPPMDRPLESAPVIIQIDSSMIDESAPPMMAQSEVQPQMQVAHNEMSVDSDDDSDDDSDAATTTVAVDGPGIITETPSTESTGQGTVTTVIASNGEQTSMAMTSTEGSTPSEATSSSTEAPANGSIDQSSTTSNTDSSSSASSSSSESSTQQVSSSESNTSSSNTNSSATISEASSSSTTEEAVGAASSTIVATNGPSDQEGKNEDHHMVNGGREDKDCDHHKAKDHDDRDGDHHLVKGDHDDRDGDHHMAKGDHENKDCDHHKAKDHNDKDEHQARTDTPSSIVASSAPVTASVAPTLHNAYCAILAKAGNKVLKVPVVVLGDDANGKSFNLPSGKVMVTSSSSSTLEINSMEVGGNVIICGDINIKNLTSHGNTTLIFARAMSANIDGKLSTSNLSSQGIEIPVDEKAGHSVKSCSVGKDGKIASQTNNKKK